MKETIITIQESFIITIFSMAIVFIGLLLISFIIGLLKNLDKKDKKIENQIIEEIVKDEIIQNDEELVAVISAAIACSIDVGVEDIVIKNIKRVDDDIDSWSKAALGEQMLSRL